MFEWKAKQGDGFLRTLGASTCTALSIHDPGLQYTFLGHIPTRTDASERTLHEMLEAVESSLGDPAGLRVWTGGAYIGREGAAAEYMDAMALDDRRFVLDAITTQLGLPRDLIQTTWLSKPGYIDYLIDTASGRTRIEMVDT